ncbi:hypothetical protein ACH5AL_03870 [Actinacidiphila glaucinigra]|uniref:hypothetical protein n=1 Tax=Actinacidiphila glaucinigra TaxID=235986 RepID=UPI00379A5A62
MKRHLWPWSLVEAMEGAEDAAGDGKNPGHRGAGDGHPTIAPGTLVRDTFRQRNGILTGHIGPYFQLRPETGGEEWAALPEHVKRADNGTPDAEVQGQYCCRCQTFTTEPAPVREAHGEAGGGFILHVCPPCRPAARRQHDALST